LPFRAPDPTPAPTKEFVAELIAQNKTLKEKVDELESTVGFRQLLSTIFFATPADVSSSAFSARFWRS
jgi:hypothetical protein